MVGIETASMTAVFRENTAERKAETWERYLVPFNRVEFVISDAAKGIANHSTVLGFSSHRSVQRIR